MFEAAKQLSNMPDFVYNIDGEKGLSLLETFGVMALANPTEKLLEMPHNESAKR